jgi:hypothetical protein
MHSELVPQNLPEAVPERRRHLRYRFSVPLTIHSADGASIPAMSIEISESGISAITAGPLRLNETVELEPVAAGKVLALVRRDIGRVYGFEFINLSAEQVQRIRESCKMLARYQGSRLGI